MASNREWTTRERAYLKKHYPGGKPVSAIASYLNRSIGGVMSKARKLGLRHPYHSSQQAIANFEALHGRPIADIAREYRDRRLSRGELAAEVGVDRPTLRAAIGEALWQSWPHMTIGRVDAARERRKAA